MQLPLTTRKAAINGDLPSFPMRAELLSLPAEARPAAALGGCEDTLEARGRGESCAMLLRAAYRWALSGYHLV